MPTFIGSKGGVLGCPALRGRGPGAVAGSRGGIRQNPVRSFNTSDHPFVLRGVTRDSGGTPLGGCTVDLYDTRTDVKVQTTTSDGSGDYSFGVGGGPYYVVAYLPGGPDVFGTTVNTLVGT